MASDDVDMPDRCPRCGRDEGDDRCMCSLSDSEADEIRLLERIDKMEEERATYDWVKHDREFIDGILGQRLPGMMLNDITFNGAWLTSAEQCVDAYLGVWRAYTTALEEGVLELPLTHQVEAAEKELYKCYRQSPHVAWHLVAHMAKADYDPYMLGVMIRMAGALARETVCRVVIGQCPQEPMSFNEFVVAQAAASYNTPGGFAETYIYPVAASDCFGAVDDPRLLARLRAGYVCHTQHLYEVDPLYVQHLCQSNRTSLCPLAHLMQFAVMRLNEAATRQRNNFLVAFAVEELAATWGRYGPRLPFAPPSEYDRPIDPATDPFATDAYFIRLRQLIQKYGPLTPPATSFEDMQWLYARVLASSTQWLPYASSAMDAEENQHHIACIGEIAADGYDPFSIDSSGTLSHLPALATAFFHGVRDAHTEFFAGRAIPYSFLKGYQQNLSINYAFAMCTTDELRQILLTSSQHFEAMRWVSKMYECRSTNGNRESADAARHSSELKIGTCVDCNSLVFGPSVPVVRCYHVSRAAAEGRPHNEGAGR
jgi:hypothetical protein